MKVAPNAELELLQPSELESELARRGLSEFQLLYQRETESTNLDVLRHFEQSGQQAIATCEMQTAGKGRRGREWISPFAQNIYCTVGMVKSIPSENLGLLSIVSGISLCRALSNCGIEGVRLKWPNDLVYSQSGQKKKLGGILIESKPAGDGYFLAIGFGLNVRMTSAQLDAIPQGATSLGLISNRPMKRQSILLAAIEAVVTDIRQFDSQRATCIGEEFAAYDAFHNEAVRVLTGGDQIDGMNVGINSHGQLLLKTSEAVKSFSAAEISLRGAD